MSLEDHIATRAGKRRYVRSLFTRIADRYDLITIVLSYGRDRGWKRHLLALAAPARGERVLDLATGTGDIAFAAARHSDRVVGLDITERMIRIAQRKARTAEPSQSRVQGSGARQPRFVVGDMLDLPFRSHSFDLVTTGYGLRNASDLAAALDEIARVLRPGGRALSLEFNRPANRLVRAAYLAYLTIVGSALGWVLHGDPDTYRYIAASLRTFPGAEGLADLMRRRGFERVLCYRLLGGLMAIHYGVKG